MPVIDASRCGALCILVLCPQESVPFHETTCWSKAASEIANLHCCARRSEIAFVWQPAKALPCSKGYGPLHSTLPVMQDTASALLSGRLGRDLARLGCGCPCAQNEIDRVNLEIQNAERDYDLNRAAELKYGTLLQLQKQLREAEQLLEREMVRRIPPYPAAAQPHLRQGGAAAAAAAAAGRGRLGWPECTGHMPEVSSFPIHAWQRSHCKPMASLGQCRMCQCHSSCRHDICACSLQLTELAAGIQHHRQCPHMGGDYIVL